MTERVEGREGFSELVPIEGHPGMHTYKDSDLRPDPKISIKALAKMLERKPMPSSGSQEETKEQSQA